MKIIDRIRLAIWLLQGNIIVCYNTETRELLGAITDEGTIATNCTFMEFVSKDKLIRKNNMFFVAELKDSDVK